jgi:hypothetical protein
MSFKRKFGSRAQVWDGEAEMTRGKLTRVKLTENSRGKIVSKHKSEQSKKRLSYLLGQRDVQNNNKRETPERKTEPVGTSAVPKTPETLETLKTGNKNPKYPRNKKVKKQPE